ncbi:MAG: hypothetical protein ACXVAS_17760 [Vulcanimicrobiaceae bacterium]
MQEFCKSHSTDPLRATDLGPILWGKTAEQAYRELDAAALLREVMIFDTVQVVIEAYYFIEAKYRQAWNGLRLRARILPVYLQDRTQRFRTR